MLEISVYHNPEQHSRTEDLWALLVRLLRKERRLGVLSRWTEMKLDQQTLAPLEDLFRRRGISLRRAPAGSS